MSARAECRAHDPYVGMVLIPAGTFLMGSDRHYPEEAPVRRVSVDSFWIDRTPVTNAEFRRFVEATGYVTTAEVAPDPAQYPGMPEHMRHPGSIVFVPQAGRVPLDRGPFWWEFRFGAHWRQPFGPGDSIAGKDDHPVTQVSYFDAEAYARWAGKSLPTEAESEYAARGGLEGADYAWGDRLEPDGRVLANYWRGEFPWRNDKPADELYTTAVGRYPPNGYGLLDMIGNVWEWTCDWYGPPQLRTKGSGGCCVPHNPRGVTERQSLDPAMPEVPIGRKVLKGGSHLCAENYCRRYRPAARYPQAVDTSTTHIGFRCVIRNRPEHY